ncbi:translation initiation factor 2 subunit 1 [Pancytospora philotis]|nr:translation initiation factor 2 subunit 1 [Pancytospora philotis]
MYECRIKDSVYPSVGELVLAKTVSIKNNIITMSLAEYGSIPGLVLSSEVSKKKIRSIHQITKVGSAEVCQVLKVDEAKGHIDLSLKSVGDEEKKDFLEQSNRNKFAYQIMLKVSKLAGVPVQQLYEDVGYAKSREHGSLHAYFADAQKDPGVWADNPHRENFIEVIEKQFKPESYKIRVDVDVTSPREGVAAIKECFLQAKAACPGLGVAVLRTPTYSMTYMADDKDHGFAVVNEATEIVSRCAVERGGTCAVSVPAKVYGEKFRYTVLNKEEEAGAGDGSSDDSDDSSD